VIAYFDTSALVPLLVSEPGTERAVTLWDAAGHVVSSRLSYPEGRAALAQAHRLDRLTNRGLRDAVDALDACFEEIDLVEVDDGLARRAGQIAEVRALRGYDAVHLASALLIQDADLVMVSGDLALLAAARAEGMSTAALVP